MYTTHIAQPENNYYTYRIYQHASFVKLTNLSLQAYTVFFCTTNQAFLWHTVNPSFVKNYDAKFGRAKHPLVVLSFAIYLHV